MTRKEEKPVNGNDLKTEKASMTGNPTAEPLRWNLIEWEKVEREVSRLQSRIAKAEYEGKREKVRKLQRRLTRSFSAKLLAVRKVTTNKGKNTPGADGVIWKTPAEKMAAAQSLKSEGYKAKPLRRVNIPKKGKKGKTRPLGIPTMHDRAMQALHALALEPVAEVTGDRHSFGFRKGRSAQDAYAQMHNVLSKDYSPKWILEGDIRGCFDHISHAWLMENVPMDKKVLGQFLKAGFMEQGGWHETDEGTPQGGIISPILANMALDGIDRLLDEKYHSRNGRASHHESTKNKVNFVRYADDFVITAVSEELAREVKAAVARFLAERGLELSEEKTAITHIDGGFDFLGWTFRKFDGKLVAKPSRKSVKAFLRDVHRTILREGRAWKQEELIDELAPKIRGFANYHRHACSSKTFVDIDHHIYVMLSRWAKRRHPKKGGKWRYSRYWTEIGNRKYIFGSQDHYLPCMTWQHIVRHPSLRLETNPYLDPTYYENRGQMLKERYAHSFRKTAAKRP